jgi:hypothetical protein
MPPALTTSRARRWLASIAIALGVLALLVATEPALSITWDEGYTLGRIERVRAWLWGVADPVGFSQHWHPPTDDLVQPDAFPKRPPDPRSLKTRASLFTPEAMEYFWPFSREEPHGHPPFYALVGLAGDAITPWRPALPRARLGGMIAFAITAAALWGFCRQRWGSWPAIAATAAFVFQPNLFAHAHYAGYDGLLTSIWILAIILFADAENELDSRRNALRVVALGLLFGWAADTKLTGWFLPLPFLAWAAVFRDARRLRLLLLACAIGAVTLYLFNPPWWLNPIGGIDRFLKSNLNRGRSIPIQVLFLGQVYSTPDGSLPWYNTLVWTALVTPVGFLALGLLGFARSCRAPATDRITTLVALHWLFFLLLRAMPHTPGHDGVRLFLPAFGCLALLTAPGAAWLMGLRHRIGAIAVGTSTLEGVASLALLMPVPLSYFSPIVGGLPGAARLGMEPTYYWDALDSATLEWLANHSGANDKVAFATNPTSWRYLARIGAMRFESSPSSPRRHRWYVVQNRPGAFSPLDRALIARNQPVYARSKFGVPLIWVFPFEQVEAWQRAHR